MPDSLGPKPGWTREATTGCGLVLTAIGLVVVVVAVALMVAAVTRPA